MKDLFRKNKLLILALAALLVAEPCFAAVGIKQNGTRKETATDINFKGGAVITGSGEVSVDYSTPTLTGGTIDNAVIGGTTPAAGNFANLTYKRPVYVISTPGDTPGVVTAARTGSVFVLASRGVAAGGVGYTLTLPAASTGLEYHFVTDTGSTLSVRTASTTDKLEVATGVNRVTSPSSTGSALVVVGGSGVWYVKQMDSPGLGGPAVWTTGSF